MSSSARTIFIVAGEASADLHAAALLSALKRIDPSLNFFGVGGKELSAAGMELSIDARALNVVGGADWLDKAAEVIGAYRRISKLVRERRPDCAILLDLPDFNLRLAKKLKRLGIPVIYYISPQVWAWRKYRVKTIRKCVDKMLVVFPFERDFYEARGVPVHFVGHPLLDSIEARKSYRNREERLAQPRIAILPGSRRSELKYHSPPVLDFIRSLFEKYPAAEVRVPVASTLSSSMVRELLPDPRLRFEEGNAREVMAWADVAVVASGTATLETALVGTPFCLFYRLSASSAFFFQRVWRYSGFLGMPNLLHGQSVVREFFQKTATGANLLEETGRLLEQEDYRRQMIESLRDCHRRLGEGGASERAARYVLEALGDTSQSTAISPKSNDTLGKQSPILA